MTLIKVFMYLNLTLVFRKYPFTIYKATAGITCLWRKVNESIGQSSAPIVLTLLEVATGLQGSSLTLEVGKVLGVLQGKSFSFSSNIFVIYISANKK